MKSFAVLLAVFICQSVYSQTTTLRDTTNEYDYVIITVPEFVSACVPFKEHKETVRGFKTIIVDTSQIYAEFNSGSTPQDNIRDFISYAGTFWKNPQPKYFLIAGTVQLVPNYNISYSPLWSSPYYQSDFYYRISVYDNDTTNTKFYLGRIPAKNTTQLENYFSKVIDYENDNSIESWMNNSLFICEDEPNFDFLGGAFEVASNYPSYIQPGFIINDESSIYYGNRDSIYKAINQRGTSTLWFEGHSTDSSFAYSDMFNLQDVDSLANQNKYFFSVFIATQSAIIDTNTNITNEMLFLPDAGSIGAVAISGPSFWGVGKSFQNKWAGKFYNSDILSSGEVFDVDDVPNNGFYWLENTAGNLWGDPSLKLKYDIPTSVEDDKITPTGFALLQNYPNPFNPSTKIKYTIGSKQYATLRIYDVLGNEVATLVDEEKPTGTYEVEFNGNSLSSGIYFYKLRAGTFVQTKKMILLK